MADVSPWQGSFRGLVFGPGTNVALQSLDGLRSLPGVRTTDVARPGDDGDFAGYDYLAGRTLTLVLVVKGTASKSLEQALAEVEAAFSKAPGEQVELLPLVFNMPGWSEPRRVYCRTRRAETPVDVSFAGGLALRSVQLDAPDPRLLSNTLVSEQVGLPTGTGGFGFPLSFPFGFGGATSGGSATLTNSGNFPAVPQITFTGPCDAPRAENVTTGETIGFNVALAAGDFLTVDGGSRTALLNGTASRRGSLLPGSSWWQLRPGPNLVRFHAGAYNSTAAMTVAYRSSWV